MNIKILFSIFGFITIINAQVNFKGNCPNLTTQKDFDMEKYLGTWYHIQEYPTIFQKGSFCIEVIYTPGKNNTVHVENYMHLYKNTLSTQGYMKEIDPNMKDGKLKLVLPDVKFSYNLWILETDYTNYSIVWSCNQANNTDDQFAYVLSRTPNITEQQQIKINAILDANHLDVDKFIQVNQTNCKYHGNSGSISSISFTLFMTLFILTKLVE